MPIYKVIDDNGRTRATIPGVLAPVALTGVSTTSGSNILTVASTTGVYPGMSIAAPNFPAGCFVLAVKNATTLEVWKSSLDRTTGLWTTTAANANATASASSLLAMALGFSPLTLIEAAFAMGMWQNIFYDSRTPHQVGAAVTAAATDGAGRLNEGGLPSGVVAVPAAVTYSGSAIVPSSLTVKTSDHLLATPIKRQNWESWGIWPMVSTDGHLTCIPARPEWLIHYNGADA